MKKLGLSLSLLQLFVVGLQAYPIQPVETEFQKNYPGYEKKGDTFYDVGFPSTYDKYYHPSYYYYDTRKPYLQDQELYEYYYKQHQGK